MGHISNVSHVVVPERAGVSNDGRVQWGDEPQGAALDLDKLIEFERVRLERARLKLEREQAKAVRKQQQRHARRRMPSNVRWHTWRGFALDLQRLEGLVGSRERPTKEALAMLGSDSAKTIRYTMRRYGLAPDDWPPSTWNPDEERVYGSEWDI